MGGETKLFCFGAFDPHAEVGFIEGLLNPQIGRSGDISHLREQCVCIEPVSLQVVSDDLNVDRCGQAKIEDLADHVGRQESKAHTRELLRECQTKLMNVVVRGVVIDRQRHKNVRIRCAHRRRIAVGKIDATIGQAYVVNDALDLACRNLPPN